MVYFLVSSTVALSSGLCNSYAFFCLRKVLVSQNDDELLRSASDRLDDRRDLESKLNKETPFGRAWKRMNKHLSIWGLPTSLWAYLSVQQSWTSPRVESLLDFRKH